MKKLFAIGEALIDFIPEESGKELRYVSGFQPKVGGAPANVCGAYVKLGGEGALITQLGADPFGDKIVEEFTECGIDCSHVKRTEKANTSLAFVALKEDGNREFSFYRKPGADMMMEAKDIEDSWFTDVFALHFCSVSLGDFPMKEAHKKAIDCGLRSRAVISFDPNIRLALWENPEALRNVIWEFAPMAHVLKISDEELEFITGETDIKTALPKLLRRCLPQEPFSYPALHCGQTGFYPEQRLYKSYCLICPLTETDCKALSQRCGLIWRWFPGHF